MFRGVGEVHAGVGAPLGEHFLVEQPRDPRRLARGVGARTFVGRDAHRAGEDLSVEKR